MSSIQTTALSAPFYDARRAVQPGKEVAIAPVLDDQAHAGLAEQVASHLTGARGLGARAGGDPELRAPTLSLHEAQLAVAGVHERARVALQAVLEKSSAQMVDQRMARQPVDAPRQAPEDGWIVRTAFSELLALLRQLLLRFEKMDRDHSVNMVNLSREMTITAGERGVKKAQETLGGAIGGGIVMGSVGAAAVQQSMKSTKVKVDSTKVNKVGAQKTGAAGQVGSEIDAPTGTAGVSGGAGASVAAEPTPPSPAMGNNTTENKTKSHVTRKFNEDDIQHTRAQIRQTTATTLNLMAPSTNAIVTSGVGIQAEATEAERQMALHVVDVYKRTADEEQDQANKTRDQRDATAQLVDSLLNIMMSTSGHIIQRF